MLLRLSARGECIVIQWFVVLISFDGREWTVYGNVGGDQSYANRVYESIIANHVKLVTMSIGDSETILRQKEGRLNR